MHITFNKKKYHIVVNKNIDGLKTDTSCMIISN